MPIPKFTVVVICTNCHTIDVTISWMPEERFLLKCRKCKEQEVIYLGNNDPLNQKGEGNAN